MEQTLSTNHPDYVIQSTVVYFESPSPQDIQEGRIEYHSVGNMLNLMNIPCYRVEISEREQLKKKFQELPSVLQLKSSMRIFLHFSSHGNSKGIGLYSGEFVSWEDLTSYFSLLPQEFKNKITLCFSTCEGSGSIEIGKNKWLPQYAYTIAPNREVEWAESAVAFAVFYYLHIVREFNIKNAVDMMNMIAFNPEKDTGNVYVYSTGILQAKFTEIRNIGISPSVARMMEYARDSKEAYDKNLYPPHHQ